MNRLYRLVTLGLFVFILALTTSVTRADEAADAAWQRTIQGTPVTLKLENVMWREAYEKFGAATGTIFKMDQEEPRYSLPISLDIKGVPFWKALDMLLEEAPAQIDPQSGAFRLYWTHNITKFPLTLDSGPVRIRLRQYNAARSVNISLLGNEPHRNNRRVRSNPQINFLVTPSPKCKVSGYGLQLTEAIDDTGRDLIAGMAENQGHGIGQYPFSASYQGGGNIDIYIRTQLPAREAKTIKRIVGTVTLAMLPDLPAIRLELGDSKTDILIRGLRFNLTDYAEKGRAHVVTFSGAPDQDHSVIQLFSKYFHQAVLVDADGKPFEKRGSGSSSDTVATTLTFRYSRDKDRKPVALLLPGATESRMHEFPFEFVDVPLPDMNSAYFAHVKTDPPRPKAEAPVKNIPRLEHILPLSELKGSTFTLKAEAMPLNEVFAEIEKQTGNKIEARGFQPAQFNENNPMPTLTAELDKVSFWQGLDVITQKTGVRFWMSNRNNETVVSAGRQRRNAEPQPENEYVQYFGPARVAMQGVGLRCDAGIRYSKEQQRDFQKNSNVYLSASGQIWLEPRLNVAGHGARVITAFGDDGIDYSEKKRQNHNRDVIGSPKFFANISRSPRPEAAFNFSMNVLDQELPDRFDDFSIYYMLQLASEESTTEVAVDEAPFVRKLEGGVKLRWAGMIKSNGRRSLRFGFTLPASSEMDSNQARAIARKIKFMDDAGKKLQIHSSSNVINGRTVVIDAQVRDGVNPKTVIIPQLGDLTAYGDVITFENVPIPELPPVE